MAEKLAQLQIRTVQDLLLHLPMRYEDRTKVSTILRAPIQESVQIEGEVVNSTLQFSPRRSLLCTIEDGTGVCRLRFFYFNAYQKNQLQPGVRVRCFGVMRFSGQVREIIHPEYQVIPPGVDVPLSNTLTPVYPATTGVSQSLLRKMMQQVLHLLQENSLECLPEEVRQEAALAPLDQAIFKAHQPQQGVAVNVERLAFDELLVHHLRLKRARALWQQDKSISLPESRTLLPTLLAQLPFELTRAQQRVLRDIAEDMARDQPMMRLIQGDVGSGKTVVAFAAALSAIEAGQQVALMAPTEILSEQHFQSFTPWCEACGITMSWLAGSTKAAQRKTILADLASGTTQLVVGTHALFQDAVNFRALGLVIIDEQHRFGVDQRAQLVAKGSVAGVVPHRLVMTATPIPRSLAMTAYADLDCSVIDELPPGRTPVQTVAINNKRRDDVVARVRANCEQGQQVYWVCTLIEASESVDCQNAEDLHQALQAELPEQTVGLVHGRMKPDEKDQVMQAFKRGALDVLVATTVIEVGVDVPNASLMVIENPERLGLSQLHQLRGRVGRGALKSVCVLLFQSGLTQVAKSRIDIMRQTNDGFVIAEQDLLLRGPGELLGTRQAGEIGFKFADLVRDQRLIPTVQRVAKTLLTQHPDVVDRLLQRWVQQEATPC